MFRGKSEIGDVYAIITSKGYALAQVCDDGKKPYETTEIRIFEKLYDDIPNNWEQIVQGEEDWRIYCHIRTMPNKKYNMAKKLGRCDLPKSFVKTKFFKDFNGFITTENKPVELWLVGGGSKRRAKIYEWIIEDLKMDPRNDDWKEIFKKLDFNWLANGCGVIEALENGTNFRQILPDDIDIPSRILFAEELKNIKFN